MASKMNNSTMKRRVRYKLHLRYQTRFVLYCLLIIILFCGLFASLHQAFSMSGNEIVTYKEVSNVDYKIYLKDNNFYETPYLEKGMAYVASLIDRVTVKYNYMFESSVESDLDIEYQVIAKLIIASKNNSNIFYEKEFELTKPVTDEIIGKTSYKIDKDIEIDYQYYNNLANQFRANYAVYTTSHLEVYLQTTEKNKESNSYDLNNTSKNQVLLLPLSEQEINIKLDNTNIDNVKSITQDEKFVIKSMGFVLVSIIILFLIIGVIISCIRLIYLFTKKNLSSYDKHIRKLLIGYDRIIINVKSVPHRKDYNIIEVENFQELIDVRDNTKEPINYHVIKEHQKCEFFVINDDNLYLYKIEASFFDKDDKNEE